MVRSLAVRQALALSMTFAFARGGQAQAALEVTVIEAGSSAPRPGVVVTARNPSTAFSATATTDGNGKARFSGLTTAGAFTVSVPEASTHGAAKAEGLTLRSNFDRSVTLVAPRRPTAAETVTVTADTSVAEVNAVNAEVSSTLGPGEIEALPLEGRDLTRSLHRLPNVTPATGFYPEAPNVSVNGANSLYTSYVVDGLDNNENFLGGQKFAVPTGFSQQVSVLTSGYSPEFGRTGNGIFNVTSRSGGNEYRGEAFYVVRPGPALDASSPFAQKDLSGNDVKDGFQRHQAGFVLGGPLARDRTFFFANAEYSRDRKDNLLSVPALGVNETVRGHNRFLYLSGKVDHRWNGRVTSAVRVNVGRVSIERQGGGLDGGVTFPSAGSAQDRDSILAAGHTVYTRAGFVWETALQYARFRWNYAQPVNPGDAQAVVLGPTGETIAVLGHPGYVFDDVEDTVQAQQKLTFVRGRHRLKVGIDFLTAGFALAGGGNVNGNYTVALTQAQVDAMRALRRGSSLGIHDVPPDAEVVSYGVELQPATFGKRQSLLGVYAEDLFTVTPRLNLTLGLRYDYDNLSRGGAPRADTDNLAPRLAANYRLGERSVVRAGYGLYYDKVLYAYVSDALQQGSRAAGYREQLRRLVSLGILPPSTDLDAVTFDGNLSAGYVGVPYLGGPTSEEAQGQRQMTTSFERRILNPDGYPNPRTRQLSAGYQRQFGRRHLFCADLMHAITDGLPRLVDLNAPAPWPIDPARVVVRTEAEAIASRPVPILPGGARSVIVTQNAGKARYSAVNLSLIKDRGGDAYAYRFSYTLSRLRNDTDDINFRAQDANDFAAEYGPSINDRTHVVSAVAWAYPWRGLSVSLAALGQSGQPINRIPDARIYGTTDLNGDGRSFGDAYVGNSDRWPGAARNGDRLPASWLFDLGAQYRFSLGRGQGLELRADVFNLWNHTNLSGYTNNATQSNQIQIGPPGGPVTEKNAGAPRQFQFGLRWLF